MQMYADGEGHSLRDAIVSLAQEFKLSVLERKELLPSGQRVFDNRVSWARTYMGKAGLLEPVRRGVYRITKRGLDVLKQAPGRIGVAFLEQFQEFQQFRAPLLFKTG